MIDFHSHILPNVDDGSASVEESIVLLNMLSQQGVDAVCATPHFYANHETVDEFIRKRDDALESLKDHLPKDAPEIFLGAEVRYYEGISRMAGLNRLCLNRKSLLLLEMSMGRWSEYTVRELVEMAATGKYIIVLAHIERYFDHQNKDVWKRLLESGILMQVNASAIADKRSKRKALSLFKKNMVHFIGSDCHNLAHRPPYVQQAIEIIEKKFGSDYLNAMFDFGKRFV